MIGVFHKWRESVVVLAVALWALQLKQNLDPTFLKGWFILGDPNMVRLAFVFSIGMIFYLFRDKIVISDLFAAVMLAVLLVSVREALYYGVGVIAWGYLCMWAAVRLPFHNVDRYGDFSYGLYIYAFPVQQLFALYHVNDWGLAPYVFACLGGTMVLAVASWYVVERPCLRLKRLNVSRFRSSASLGDPANEVPATRRRPTSVVARVLGTRGAAPRRVVLSPAAPAAVPPARSDQASGEPPLSGNGSHSFEPNAPAGVPAPEGEQGRSL
jgi:peptidoglycan/LPS O-acetylase OafA/YrhL